MHPLARVFQIVLLIFGIFFTGVGYSIFYSDYDQVATDVNLGWTCEVKDSKEICTTGNGSLNSKTKDEAHLNIGAGIALILASVAVAAGGRRRAENPAAGNVVPQPAFGGPMPPQGPPPPPQGGPQHPGPPQQY